MQSYKLNHITQLESEAIFVLRETAAQFEKPVLLFSGGKDSIVMAHLAYKAFHPARLPFPLPGQSSYVGASFYSQWIVLDPGASNGVLAVSNGMRHIVAFR